MCRIEPVGKLQCNIVLCFKEHNDDNSIQTLVECFIHMISFRLHNCAKN